MLRNYVFAIGLIMLVGCAGRGDIPKQFPSDVNNWTGCLDHVQFLQDFNITDFRQIRVEFDTSNVSLPEPDDNTYKPVVAALHNAVDTFSAGIRDNLNRPPILSDYSGGTNTLLIRAAVTEMNPGSQAARVWVGLGAGVAVTTIKGDVVDQGRGLILLHFENSIKDAAGLPGYEDLLNGDIRRTGQRVGTLLSDFTQK